MNNEEFIDKYKEFMSVHAQHTKENIEMKIRSHYELLKATGKKDEELFIEMLQYTAFDVINKSLTLALSEVWGLNKE